jgi:hypothetical protein
MTFDVRNRKLFEAITSFDDELKAAIFTTYNFDGAYFEGKLLPALLDVRADDQEDEKVTAIDLIHKLKQTAIVVVADGRANKADKTKNLYGYDQVTIFKGTQHAKIFLLQFSNAFRLIIGSANLTEKGLHKNKEVYVEIDIDQESEHLPILNDTLEFLEAMSSATEERFHKVLNGMKLQAERLSKSFKLERPYGARFVGITPEKGKLNFAILIKDFLKEFGMEGTAKERVDELYILSPFYEEPKSSKKGESNSLLANEYFALKGDHPRYPSVYIYPPTSGDNITTPFPVGSYRELAEKLGDKFLVFQNSEITSEDNNDIRRFPHSKLYAVTNDPHYTMLVLGSSNFSPSGFGQRSRGKNNWEANVSLFTTTKNNSTLRKIFPKDKYIDDSIWMNWQPPTDQALENPDVTSDDLIVLTDAVYQKGKLSLTAVNDDHSKYTFKVGNLPVSPIWTGFKGVLDGPIQHLSVEVRDKEDKLIQDLPIFFSDYDGIPIEMEISPEEMVNWIESRYLYKRHQPLSRLLGSNKKSPKLNLTQVSTDEYLMYRVKTFNNLVAKIYDKLYAQRDHFKQVEYHLTGQFGLIKCIERYLDIKEDLESEVFSVYQAVEVISSVLAAFEGAQVKESVEVAQRFWAEASQILKLFKPKSGAHDQLIEYIEQLSILADKVLVA